MRSWPDERMKKIFVVVLFLLLEAATTMAVACPAGCYCDEKKFPDHPGLAEGNGLRVSCHRLASGSIPDFRALPATTVHLDLAKYGMTEITDGMFLSTPNLLKLDLQNNDISHIDEGSFATLSHLEVLDLSQNHLEVITTGTFEGLLNMNKLKLSDNRIQAIENGAFEHFRQLSKLDIADNPFICDCNIFWFVKWLDDRPNLLVQSPKCALPIDLTDIQLRKVDHSKLICSTSPYDSRNSNYNRLPFISLTPNDNLVVFKGDSLKISCRSSIQLGSSHKLDWSISGSPLQEEIYKNVTLSSKTLEESKILETSVHVHSVSEAHTGEWSCVLRQDGSEVDKRSLNVLVLSENSKICDPDETRTLKGNYSWGAAIGGHTVQQSCEKNKVEDKYFGGLVVHFCQENGFWSPNVNASFCGYTNEITATLFKFSTMNITFSFSANALVSSAKHFLNFTSNPNTFNNKMDIVYFVRAIENYLPFIHRGGELGHYIMSMLENLIEARRDLMKQAQDEDDSSNKILNVLNNVTLILPSFQHHTNKLAVEKYTIYTSFDGVTCTWYSTGLDNIQYRFAPRRVFHCADKNKTLPSRGKIVLASVAVPKATYLQITKRSPSDYSPPHSLAFSVFSNDTFFPSGDVVDMSYPVIGVNLESEHIGNLSEAIVIVLRTETLFSSPSSIEPVWWDGNKWNPDYCRLINYKAFLIWFSCKRIGFFSYRKRNHGLEGIDEVMSHSGFRLHHPMIYVGGVLSLILVLSSIFVFCISFSWILISKALKHALVNLWVAQVLLLFLFCTGIYQVEDLLTCRGVSLAIHYFTLCNMLWIVISINIIFQKVNAQKQRQNQRQQNEFLRSNPIWGDQRGRRGGKYESSLVRFYLVGWGVSAVICGISGALNIDSYSSETHCFMTLTPFLASVVLPGALLTALMIGFALSAWCIVSSSPSHISEQFESEHCFRQTTRTSPLSVASSKVPDQEKTVKSLLLAHAYIYVLFLSMWMCGSLAVVQPFRGALLQEELIFSALFTVSSVSLGVFIFVYFCASRMDVQESWRSPPCCSKVSQQEMLEVESSNLVHLNPEVDQPHRQDGVSSYDRQIHKSLEVDGNKSYNGTVNQKYPRFGGSQVDQQQQKTVFGGENCYGVSRNYGRTKELKNQRKSSDESSEHLSLNNINHLRRGYVAPVNSEAEYGLLGGPLSNNSGLLGPKLNTITDVERDYSELAFQPKTSSPAAGLNVPFAADITLSPLVNQESKDNNETLESHLLSDDLEYTESSTIKMGAPCEMASFPATSELAAFSASNTASPTRNNPQLPTGFGKPSNWQQEKQRRKYYKTVPEIGENDIDETTSKFSGVSSTYSSKSGRSKNKKHKRPNKRKARNTGPNIGEVEKEVASQRHCVRSGVRNAAADDNYLGDNDCFDSEHRLVSPVLLGEETDIIDLVGTERGSSQFPKSLSPCDMPSRETSV